MGWKWRLGSKIGPELVTGEWTQQGEEVGPECVRNERLYSLSTEKQTGLSDPPMTSGPEGLKIVEWSTVFKSSDERARSGSRNGLSESRNWKQSRSRGCLGLRKHTANMGEWRRLDQMGEVRAKPAWKSAGLR